MKTAYKIAAARAAYRLLHATRAIVGLGDELVATRRGIRYALDLSQGIDLAIYLQGQFEPTTAKAYARFIRPNDVVVDIGANVGAHTLNLARLVGPNGRVIAVEPTGNAFKKLQQTLSLNPSLAERVTTRQCFLAANNETAPPKIIYSTWPLKPEDGLHPKHRGKPSTANTTIAKSLDTLLEDIGERRQVALIKMDVDGHECDVLKGAHQLMNRDRPVFVMELAPYALEECGTSLDDLLSFFLPLGYSLFHERTGEKLPIDAQKLISMIGDGGGINVVATTRK